jgi:hypothetical protein
MVDRMIQNSNCAKFGLQENYEPKLEANFWDSSKNVIVSIAEELKQKLLVHVQFLLWF